MISFPNCKINIGLSVIEKRPDGYHNIESVLYPIQLCDILEIIKSSRFSFTSSGLPTGEGINLCVQAYRLLKKHHRITGVNLHLHKNIPVGAGLGGGSSDAAFTISMLNKLFTLKLSKEKMKRFAADLGSDCPFFIINKPVIASSRGEILSKTDLNLKNYNIFVVFPEIAVSTSEAYKTVIPTLKQTSLAHLVKFPVNEWKNLIFNDFESGVFAKYPEIKRIKETFYELGAVYASMSGSGSSVYGIFEKEKTDEAKIMKNNCFSKYKLYKNNPFVLL